MRDLNTIDHAAIRNCRWCGMKRARIVAHIERLEAENERLRDLGNHLCDQVEGDGGSRTCDEWRASVRHE